MSVIYVEPSLRKVTASSPIELYILVRIQEGGWGADAVVFRTCLHFSATVFIGELKGSRFVS